MENTRPNSSGFGRSWRSLNARLPGPFADNCEVAARTTSTSQSASGYTSGFAQPQGLRPEKGAMMKHATDAYHKLDLIPGPGEKKIMLVDGDTSDLEFYSSVLQHQGYEVVACASYAAALRVLEREDFDLVVVNQGGPKFEGRCVLESVKQDRRNVPVLVMANHADMGNYLKAMEMGATDYFEKAVNPSEWIRLIRGYLRPAQATPAIATAG